MYRYIPVGLTVLLLTPAAVVGQQDPPELITAEPAAASEVESAVPPADWISRSLTDPQLEALVRDALERNPGVAQARALARAAELRAPQRKALPDPVAGITAWLASPETRTGPQVLTLSWMQALPWLSKFDLKEQATLLEASALQSEVEKARLELVTTVRSLYYELAFLARYREISLDYLDHLRQHEEISRSRYATGMGASQNVIKIQAEITRAENVVIDLDRRRIELEAKLNRLRDRPPSTVIVPPALPEQEDVQLDFPTLLETAQRVRPEVHAIDARIAASEVRSELAEKEYRPNFSVGLTYTLVDPRDDPAGVMNPPAGNGDDILGLQGSVSVPIWRKKLHAGTAEASAIELSLQETKRGILAEIAAGLGDLLQRIPLTWQQLRLLEDILILQAEESVRSAESAYVSGNFNALDLLDAEHVLFQTETAIARAQADYLIRLAELEGEVGQPVLRIPSKE